MQSINDNEVAIDMLKDVTRIIEGIETNRSRTVREGIDRLRKHLSEFEKVFQQFENTYN